MVSDFASNGDRSPEGPPQREGPGPARVLLFALVGALIVGTAGFGVSAVVSPDQAVVQTMCVDSGCTSAMSAGDKASMSTESPKPAHHHRSLLQRGVSGIKDMLHLR